MDNEIAHRRLEEWVKDRDSFSAGPSFAFGYKADCSLMRSGGVDIKITRNEEPSSSFAMLTDIYSVLSTCSEERDGVDPEDIRFAVSLLSAEDMRPFNMGGALIAVSGGIAHSYLEKGNNDITDAKYFVDNIGLRVLEAGVKHGQSPICAKADYNFCGIGNIAEDSRGLAELIGKIN